MASKRKRSTSKAADEVPTPTPGTVVLVPPSYIRPRVGLPAPLFETDAVIDGNFKTVRLSDYAGRYLVLLFYPLDFTFVCPTEIVAFNDRYEEFTAAKADVLAVSVDSKFTHNAWLNTPRNRGGVGRLKFPLAADVNKVMARHYDVLIEHGNDSGVTLRGLFLIDTNGVLRSMIVNDLPVGRSVNETLRLVKAFQFADKHVLVEVLTLSGDVCPAEWTPGARSMKPDPVASQEYFNSLPETR